MPRIDRSSTLLAAIAVAARRALRSAKSSRMRLDSSVDWPEINCGRPPGCMALRSMRVRGVSTNWSNGDVPPTRLSSSRHWCQVGAATLAARKAADGAEGSNGVDGVNGVDGNDDDLGIVGSSLTRLVGPESRRVGSSFTSRSSSSADDPSFFRPRRYTCKTLCAAGANGWHQRGETADSPAKMVVSSTDDGDRYSSLRCREYLLSR